MKGSHPVVSCLDNFVTTDEECGNFDQFVKAAVNAFFDSDPYLRASNTLLFSELGLYIRHGGIA
jgi:hypothetical protein